MLGPVVAALIAAAAIGSNATNPIQAENANGGVPESQWLPPFAPPSSIEGYASETSVRAGDPVHLHVSANDGDRYRVEVYRLGWYGGQGARLLTCLPGCGGDEPGRLQGRGEIDPTTQVVRADWPVTDVVATGSNWVSGYYIALLRITDGSSDDVGARGYVPFIVRAPSTAPASRIVVQVPVNTWQAYNPWGGRSLYPFNSANFAPALRVSFDRPLAYTAQGPFDWEINMVRWLEHEGYDLSYQTDIDTDGDPQSLLQHRLVLVIGHDEYWTKAMRDAFAVARASGTNLAFTGSNAAYWQIRYEDGKRTIVGYKEAAPDPEPNPLLRTIKFRDVGRPECGLMGVMFLRLREHESGPVDYSVTNAGAADRWLAGTGFAAGDRILDVVGNEWDSLPDPPPPAACVKPGMKVLFHTDVQPANADAVKYTAQSGARVFAGGAQQLSWSLDPFNTNQHGRTLLADPRLEQFMRNALDDLTRPAPPVALAVPSVTGRTVNLRVDRHPDPRVKKFIVYRHAGAGTFALNGAGVSAVCVTAATCTNKPGSAGTYRYAAISLDPWRKSFPTFSRKVVLP
jgi:hypothetical protein